MYHTTALPKIQLCKALGLMNNNEEISFRYPKKIGFILIWLGLPFIVMLIFILGCAASYWIYSLEFRSEEFLVDLFKGGALLGMSLWMFASLIHWIKDRHAFITSYVLTKDGISIESVSGISELLPWSDFEYAIYHWALRYVKIYSKKLDKPVTLIFGTPGKPIDNYDLAKDLISTKLRVDRKFW